MPTVHLLENPYTPDVLHGQAVPVTVALLLILGGVFLLGFTEAVVVAIPLVALFLALNAVVMGVGLAQIVASPQLVGSWTSALTAHGTGFLDIAGPAIIAFPLLVLGLSGFETGVSMMPLVAATGADQEQLANRVKNTRKLLTAAAVIMSRCSRVSMPASTRIFRWCETVGWESPTGSRSQTHASPSACAAAYCTRCVPTTTMGSC